MGKQCWSQAVLESGSSGHSVLQTPALVQFHFIPFCFILSYFILFLFILFHILFYVHLAAGRFKAVVLRRKFLLHFYEFYERKTWKKKIGHNN